MKLSIKTNGKVLFLATSFLWLSACTLIKSAPSITINKVPPSDVGGVAKMGEIGGTVTGSIPGQRIVLYARSEGSWWIQPWAKKPFTEIRSDSTWSNSIHLGTEYAALLVKSEYIPPPKTGELPSVGNGVIAVSKVPGGPAQAGTPAPPPKTIKFSGYEWNVSNLTNLSGGTLNTFDPANVWTDDKGYLHLRISKKNGQWTSAEVALSRSLGYGTYKIVMQDVARLEPAAVFTMYTWDTADEAYHRAMKVEISRWGDPKNNKGLQYVIDPYIIATNVVRFDTPDGVFEHALHWEKGKAEFRSDQINGSTKKATTRTEYEFTSGIPSPKAETLHLNLYVFGKGPVPLENENEVVIEKFEYLP